MIYTQSFIFAHQSLNVTPYVNITQICQCFWIIQSIPSKWGRQHSNVMGYGNFSTQLSGWHLVNLDKIQLNRAQNNMVRKYSISTKLWFDKCTYTMSKVYKYRLFITVYQTLSVGLLRSVSASISHHDHSVIKHNVAGLSLTIFCSELVQCVPEV